MDKNQLVERVRSRLDHTARKRQLREKYQARMLFAHSGGMWQAGPELLALLSVCVEPNCVILDLYGTPTKVDVQDLRAHCQTLWQEQMNAWLLEHQEMIDQR